MAETRGDNPDTSDLDDGEPAVGRRRLLVPGILGTAALIVLSGLWLSRDALVDSLVAYQLRQLGLRGSYQVASAGVSKQVLTHVVIGDPAHPDLTIERVDLSVVPRIGFSGISPAIAELRLVKPRLHGSYYQGRLSFGALDKLLFAAPGKKPFRLPDMNLVIDDGRGQLESDLGAVALQIAGKGNLSGGFIGRLQFQAPKLTADGCITGPLTLTSNISIAEARPRLQGPLRLAGLNCLQRGVNLRQAQLQIDARFDETLDGGGAKLRLSTGALAYDQAHIRALDGWSELDFGHGALIGNYALTAHNSVTPQASIGALTLSGMVRGEQGLQRLASEGTLTGRDLRPGAQIDSGLAAAQEAVGAHLVAPLLAQFRSALFRQASGSRLAADFAFSRDDKGTHLIVPQAAITGGSGDRVLTLSQLRVDRETPDKPQINGTFAMAGAAMPHISGSLSPSGKGGTAIHLTMPDYRAGSTHLAFPKLDLIRAADGTIALSGSALVSGAIPDGRVDGFALPLDGRWNPGRGLWLWRKCQNFGFNRLTYGDLALDRNRVSLCPGPGGAMLRPGRKGTRIAVQAPGLALAGTLNGTRLRLTSGPLSFIGGEPLMAQDVKASFGGDDDPSQFSVRQLSADLAKGANGTFVGGQGQIHGVPLALRDAEGDWSFAAGKLTVNGISLHLIDQAAIPRFSPLLVRGMTFTQAHHQMVAEAILREAKSDRAIVDLRIDHDLQSGVGRAVMTLPGVSFDHDLQPDMLTPLAKGIIANASGTVTGQGQIDWSREAITSFGHVSSTGLDFAAAFGPAQGVSGTVVFSDLLGLVTEPDQRLKIASINPGIEVNNGLLSFALQPQGVLVINGATWPFLDGKMTLLPTQMKLTVPEVRRYVLEVRGVSASRFVEKLDMGNLAADGLFDGTLPLAFYPDGGKIEGGLLISRPPGGNVSYIGTLTYKDLSPIANFAFNTLRSLDYRRMTVTLDGDLSGEIVTRVRFDGVRQGQGAKRTFITRQIGRLPIQMNVKVRAPFFSLISNFKRMYDPSYYSAQIVSRLMDQAKKPSPPVPENPAAPQPAVQPPVIGKRP
ncbi:MAG: hypothetical protein RLZZ136_471 [Pseudomonadota bacterium]